MIVAATTMGDVFLPGYYGNKSPGDRCYENMHNSSLYY